MMPFGIIPFGIMRKWIIPPQNNFSSATTACPLQMPSKTAFPKSALICVNLRITLPSNQNNLSGAIIACLLQILSTQLCQLSDPLNISISTRKK